MSAVKLFNTFKMPPKLDPNPHELTPDERRDVEEAFACGYAPRTRVVRKLLRLCDERLERIKRLEQRAQVQNSQGGE